MDELTGRKVCELVAGLIATDGALHRDELRFLVKLFDRFGVAKTGDDEVLSPTVAPARAASLMAALPDEVRVEAVDLLIAAAAADGVIAEQERLYVTTVARAAGLDEAHIERRLAESK